jgi:hypothetical protein
MQGQPWMTCEINFSKKYLLRYQWSVPDEISQNLTFFYQIEISPKFSQITRNMNSEIQHSFAKAVGIFSNS